MPVRFAPQLRRSLGALLTGAIVALPKLASAEPTLPEFSPPDPGAPAAAWDVPGWVIIDAADDLDESELAELERDAKSLGASAFVASDLEDDTRIELSEASDVGRLIAALSGDARIESVEPLSWVHASSGELARAGTSGFLPNDPLYGEQWHLDRVGAPAAWGLSTGRGVTVAVIDTGIACATENGFTKGSDLAETRCVPGWNFVRNNASPSDDHGHGTHVAGTVAQSTDNALGGAGLAWNARLMPVKVLDKGGWGTTVDIADGIRWASDHGAHVINLSLGGPRNAKVLIDAVQHARAQGTLVVAAAGNSGGAVGFPGATEGVIAVSATDRDDRLASFSSRGKAVDIGAPGVDVVQQTVCDGGQNHCEIFPGWKGTSMASPHVAGAAALVVGLGITDPDAAEAVLRESARAGQGPNPEISFGAGILDVGASVKALRQKQTVHRALWLIGLSAVLGALARKHKIVRTFGFWLGALPTGIGLLAILPWLWGEPHAAVDVLSRPFADLDFFVGASVHRFLPLANAVIAGALLVTTYHRKGFQPVVAGFSVGTAAFLMATVTVGGHFGPFGAGLFAAWCVVNTLLLLGIARISAAERTA